MLGKIALLVAVVVLVAGVQIEVHISTNSPSPTLLRLAPLIALLELCFRPALEADMMVMPQARHLLNVSQDGRQVQLDVYLHLQLPPENSYPTSTVTSTCNPTATTSQATPTATAATTAPLQPLQLSQLHNSYSSQALDAGRMTKKQLQVATYIGGILWITNCFS